MVDPIHAVQYINSSMAMNRNVEAKVRLRDFAGTRRRIEGLGAENRGILRQVDTYFPAAGGRLKLREQTPGRAELIVYVRPNVPELRTSSYQICPISNGAELKSVLVSALGLQRRVAKTRSLYLLGRTRIHLDEVEGLGSFLELEVVLEPGEFEEVGVREAEDLLRRLGLEMEPRIPGSYADL